MDVMRRQGGMTAISWLVIIAMVAFVTMIVLKLVPVYIENFSVSSSLHSLQDDREFRADSAREVRDRLMRRLNINNVKSVTDDDIAITNDRNGYAVDVQYEVRVPFVANVDFVVSFHDSAKVYGR